MYNYAYFSTVGRLHYISALVSFKRIKVTQQVSYD